MERTASCACRRASVTVSGEPASLAVCHCTNCRRRTGSAFGVSAYFPRAAVSQVTGALSKFAFHHKEQNHDQERYFCSTCGTTLYWHISSMPKLVGIAGGCFTEQPLSEPAHSYSHSQRLPWVNIPSNWQCTG